ncbi:MAG: phosphate ABC transporter substrate-binding protein [Chitinispirillaceae bacterium]|nr:phosphate ABC transporter substrate-binding protein [Chitinispirillaceae bacterium]
MKRSCVITRLGIVGATMLAALRCGINDGAAVRIDGSTTIEPFMKRATKAYNQTRNTRFSINATGSKDGIDSLIEGKCDIAMSSMEISPEQIAHAKKKSVSLKPFLLGYDVIVPIVHPSNSVSDVAFDRLKEIYAGTIHRWSAVGGADTIIDVVDRSDASGTYFVWHKDVVPPQVTADRFTVMASNSSVMSYVAEHTNAIGYISAVFLNPEVKELTLNGIAITQNDLLLSEYHLKRPLFLYVNEEDFSRGAQTFVMFLIINDRGRQLLREAGYFASFTLAPHLKMTVK